MSLFRKSFIDTGPKAPPRKKKQGRKNGRNKKFKKPHKSQNGEQKRQQQQPMGEVKDRPVNIYRVVCRVTTDKGVTTDKEFYFSQLTSRYLAINDFPNKLQVDSSMSKMSIDICGVTPLLVDQYASEKYSGNWVFNESRHRYCMFNYMADSYDPIITFDIDDDTQNADDMIDMLLKTDLSREILMVDVPLFNQISVNKRAQLCQMFNRIYIFSEYSQEVTYLNVTRYPNGRLYSTEIKPWRFRSQQIDMIRQENKMEDEIPTDTPILVNQFEYFNDGNPNTFAIIDFDTAFDLLDCKWWVVAADNNPNDAITEIYNKRFKLYETEKRVLGKVAKIKRDILMVPRTLFNKLDASSRENLAAMFGKIWVITLLVEIHNPYLDNII